MNIFQKGAVWNLRDGAWAQPCHPFSTLSKIQECIYLSYMVLYYIHQHHLWKSWFPMFPSVLQDALGGSGQCRTVVIVTLPPTRQDDFPVIFVLRIQGFIWFILAHDGCMGRVLYIYLLIYHTNQLNMDKYTVRPMGPSWVGKGLHQSNPILRMESGTLNPVLGRCLDS